MVHLLLAFLFILSFNSPSARADVVNDFVRIDCNKELNYLEIGPFGVNGWLSANNAKRYKDELFRKYGIIDLMTLFDINKEWTRQTPIEFKTTCVLDTEDDPYENQPHQPKLAKYDITLKGYTENGNPQGRCGGWRTYSLTIKKDGVTIIDDVPYEIHCGEDEVLSNVSITPHQGYIYAGTQDSKKVLWWDRDLPITRDGIFDHSKAKQKEE